MHCSHCGQELQPDSIVCNNCGASVNNVGQGQQNMPYQAQQYQGQQNVPYQTQQYQGQQYQGQQYQGTQNQSQQYYSQNQGTGIPASHKPIGAWGYIGYNLLFSIPLVGIIMLFVFAFGGTGNINLRNYSRSFLLIMLIALILWLIFAVLLFGLLGMESMG